MKKLLLSALILLGLVLPCAAQLPPVMRSAWTTNAPAARNAAGSNITFYPLAYNVNAFEVYGNTGVPALTVRSNGYTGFNNATPLYLMDADGRVKTGPHLIWDTMPEIYFQDTTPAAEKYNIVVETNYFKIRNDSDNETRVAISDVGYVGINTNAPQGSLHVHGTTWMQPAAYNQNILQTFDNSGLAALTVLSNGYVGIGTNPAVTLHTLGSSILDGQVSIYSPSYPVLKVQRKQTTGAGVFAGFQLDRMAHATITDGVGIGQYFTVPDTGSNSTFAGMISGRLLETSDGSETGEVVIAASYQNTDPSAKQHLVVRATGTDTANVLIPNGLVGIGTNSPGSKLAVADITANGDVAMELANDVQRWKWELYGTGNDTLRLFDITQNKASILISTNHENMIVITNGRVGIGTLTPAVALDVNGASLFTGAGIRQAAPYLYFEDTTAGDDDWLIQVQGDTLFFTNYSASAVAPLIFLGNGETKITTNLTVGNSTANSDVSVAVVNDVQTWKLETLGSINDTWRLFDATANKAAIVVSTNHENMIVVTNGRVGIGTLTPTALLDVAGISQAQNYYAQGTLPYFYMNDQSASSDDYVIITDTNYWTVRNATDTRNDISIDGDGFVFLNAKTNGVAPPPIVTQPIGMFAQLAYQSTNALDMVYETYTNVITGATYDDTITNGFYANPAIGTLTNIYSGFYQVHYEFSIVSDVNVNGDEIEAEVFYDGVGDEHTADLVTIGASSGFYSLGKTHIKYLPAGTRIELKAKNISDVDQDFSITRIVFISKSP